jgi:hypothetical protein
MIPVSFDDKTNSIAFSEGEDEKNIPKFERWKPISCSKSIVGQTNSENLDEGVKNLINSVFLVCALGSCTKVDNTLMYKFVYDIPQSLADAQKNNVETRITCLVPSDVVLEGNETEYNKALNELRGKYAKEGVKPLSDTIVRMDAPTPQSKYMSEVNGKVIINYKLLDMDIKK